jgi:hypothetical protein
MIPRLDPNLCLTRPKMMLATSGSSPPRLSMLLWRRRPMTNGGPSSH